MPPMPDSLEERVSFLEGRVSDQSDVLKEIRQSLIHLDQKVDRFRGELAGRINTLDERVFRRLDGLDQRLLWLIGVQITVLLVVIGAFYRISG